MGRLRAPIAWTAVGTGVTTLVSALILVKTRGVYVGSLAWPFISDLGRAVGVLIGLAWTFNHEYQHRLLEKSLANGQLAPSVRSLSFVTCVCGVAGAIGLPLFASIDTSPPLHDVAAVALVVTEATAMYVDTFINFKVFQMKRDELDTGVFITARDGPRSVYRMKLEELHGVKRGFLLQLASVAVFTLATLVYLPLLYDAPPSVRLSIANCLSIDLGDDYCTRRMRLDDTNTKLWSYEHDIAVNEMRAVAQLIIVLTMLLFLLSFVVNNAPEEALTEHDRFTAMAKYYASHNAGSFTGSERGGNTPRSAATSPRAFATSSRVTAAMETRGRTSSHRSLSSSKRSSKSSPGRPPPPLVFV